MGFSHQRGQRTPQQSAKRVSDGLSVGSFVGVEPFEADQEIVDIAVDLDGINRGATRLPRPAAANGGGTPLAKFNRRLHRHQPTILR